MKLSWITIFLISLIGVIGCLLTTPVHLPGDSQNYNTDSFDIEIENRNCINCTWLDPTVQKRIKIRYEGLQRKFNLKSATVVDETRIIIGVTKDSSSFKKKGIDRIIVFPNELEKLETFDFDTGKDLNTSGFMNEFYWVEDKLGQVIGDLTKILLDKEFE